MIVFGPFKAIPPDEDIIVYNLSSPIETIPRLPGLFIAPPVRQGNVEKDEYEEHLFDGWYYDYLLNDMIAYSSVMQILSSLYEGHNVYICIADYSNSFISSLNESFMKFLQVRYDIKYSIINTQEDFQYIPKDGCDFASVEGINTFDSDHRRFLQLQMEYQLSSS